MKILFHTHYYLPETGPATKRISGLAENLKKNGHQIEVLTGFPSYPSGIKPDGYKKKLYMEEEINGIKIYRYYTYASPKVNLFNRLLNYFSFMISSLFFIFKRKKYDLIITSSPPLFTSLSAWPIAAVKKIPLVFDVRDIWPDVAEEIGQISNNGLQYKILDKMANFLYKKSDMITTVTNMKKEKLVSKGIANNKIKYISNGFDKSFLDNEIDQSIVKEFQLNEKFTLVYAGNVGLAQGIDVIINAAQKLKNYSNIQFLIIGDGLEKNELEEQAKELGLNNLKFLGLYPHKKILTFLEYSDASIIPLKNENLQDSVPSKLFESLGAGCPVILSAAGESAKIVNDSNGGLVVEPGNSEALKDAILKLFQNDELKSEFSQNGQDYVLGNFTREKIAKKLSFVLENL
ncbi:MAG: glycosyltransferase family 4 protein [Bacillota bacterium]